MGFDGSPLATSVSRIFTCLITFAYYYGVMPRSYPHLVGAQGHALGDDLRGTEPEDILSVDSGESLDARSSDALREPLLVGQPNGAGVAAEAAGRQGGATGNGGSGNGGSARKLPFRQAFGRFLALAIPGGIMVGLEAWSFDWTVVFCAQFGTEALDGHQSMMSISAFTYLTVPLAVAIAASIRVGNLLGAQQPKQVRVVVCLPAR
jgi:hypothetical protein